MEHLAPPEPEAPVRLSHAQAEQLVLRTVATEADALLRTAYRHSLCDDDAHDAYQRSMEIFMRRAPTLDPARAIRWLHVVVKHEAKAVRQSRTALVASEDIDFDAQEAVHVSAPEERVLDAERTTRAAEALRRLKPDELRAMWLKALGKSYGEIAQETSWSATKVNRCLTEGRRSFLERFAGIESGAECQRWEPLLSALVDGEASPAQLADLRPHLRNCPPCRATVRALHDADRPLAAVFPVGLVGLGVKLSGVLERLVPAAAGGSEVTAAGGAGGAGMLGLGGAKLAALLATGAVAVGGGGAAAIHHRHEPARARVAVSHHPAAPLRGASKAAAAVAAPAPLIAAAHRVRASTPAAPHRAASASATDVRDHELKPAGEEVVVATPAPIRGGAHSASAPAVTPAAVPPPADSSSGEFAPQP